MNEQKKYTGLPINRVDGPLKVKGEAKYAAEFFSPGMLYGYIINSTCTKGRIKNIDSKGALALTGVKYVYTHLNRPATAWMHLKYTDMDAPTGHPFRPLHDDEIKFNGQPVALVVADNFETARYAASLIKIQYEAESFCTNLNIKADEARHAKRGLTIAMKPATKKDKGNFDKAYENSLYKTDATYLHGMEHHNPLELFASTVIYEGEGKITIYDKTQGVVNSQFYAANVFGLKYKNVRVISPFVGGAFGSALRPQYQLFLAVMAALHLKTAVRVTMNRHQMFTFGHRPPTIQEIKYGADENGKITSMFHKALSHTSQFEDYKETVVDWGNMIYPCKNVKLEHKLVPLDVNTPLDMRAPGGVTGMHAVECAIDETAFKLKMDPLAFRLLNYSDTDDSTGKVYSSKALKECYTAAAEKIGWTNRVAEPRSVKRGNCFVGMGMATGIWEATQKPARAEALIDAEGKLKVCSATADIGTGTYTVMTQIAADMMGMPIDDVTFSLGDTDMPLAPLQGGSFTLATVGTAVQMACAGLKKKLIAVAQKMPGVLSKLNEDELIFSGGTLMDKNNKENFIPLKDIVAFNKGKAIISKNTGMPAMMKGKKFSKAAHSAVFAEVTVDEDLGIIRVTKLVTAVAAGRIINPKTARSQILGGMVWGISKALMEETKTDHRFGKFMNQNLGEYYIPVQTDIHDPEVIFVEEKDSIVNDLGVKGVGEIGIVGVAPAIANAIFNATGKRINELPVTLDKLL